MSSLKPLQKQWMKKIVMINRKEEEITVQGSRWKKVKREIIILVWKYQLSGSWGAQGIADKTPGVAIGKGWQNLKMIVKKSTWIPSYTS